MIIGAHSIIYSTEAEADRAFLRNVLKLPHVNVGKGWLIFGLPPAEVAVHPSDTNGVHEFYLMCDDIEAFVSLLKKRGASCSSVQERTWGLLTYVTLPGGGRLGIYQPRHARPKAMAVPHAVKKRAKKALRPRKTLKAGKRSNIAARGN